jgi:hypothetical protein
MALERTVEYLCWNRILEKRYVNYKFMVEF